MASVSIVTLYRFNEVSTVVSSPGTVQAGISSVPYTICKIFFCRMMLVYCTVYYIQYSTARTAYIVCICRLLLLCMLQYYTVYM